MNFAICLSFERSMQVKIVYIYKSKSCLSRRGFAGHFRHSRDAKKKGKKVKGVKSYIYKLKKSPCLVGNILRHSMSLMANQSWYKKQGTCVYDII